MNHQMVWCFSLLPNLHCLERTLTPFLGDFLQVDRGAVWLMHIMSKVLQLWVATGPSRMVLVLSLVPRCLLDSLVLLGRLTKDKRCSHADMLVAYLKNLKEMDSGASRIEPRMLALLVWSFVDGGLKLYPRTLEYTALYIFESTPNI